MSDRKTQRYLLFDTDECLIGWVNMATGQVKSPHPELLEHDGDSTYFQQHSALKKHAFAGIQVFFPSLLPFMNTWQGKFSIIDFYLSICDKVPIHCHFDPQLQLLDVGKLDTIAKAEEWFQ